jgi:hypothetical protein
MPIAGEEFVYEMTLNALLMPNAGGVPTWQSNNVGEKMMIKLPEQFRRALIDAKQPLSEETGEMLARWAAGTGSATAAVASKELADGALLFSKNYPIAKLANTAIEQASAADIAAYLQYLQDILDDESKSKAHGPVQKHKEAVEPLYEQAIAEEAMKAESAKSSAA